MYIRYLADRPIRLLSWSAYSATELACLAAGPILGLLEDGNLRVP